MSKRGDTRPAAERQTMGGLRTDIDPELANSLPEAGCLAGRKERGRRGCEVSRASSWSAIVSHRCTRASQSHIRYHTYNTSVRYPSLPFLWSIKATSRLYHVWKYDHCPDAKLSREGADQSINIYIDCHYIH